MAKQYISESNSVRVLTRAIRLVVSAAALAALDAGAAYAEQVEEIVVTARKRAENIQTTPVAVTAVTGAQLQARASIDLRDLKTMAPNIIIDQIVAGPNAAAISIRGISFDDIERSFDPAVGVIVDGIYLGTNSGQLAHIFDIDKVQVLRGPQGTLFGRNTTGGVITLEHTKPTGQWGANLSGTYSNYGRQDGNAVVNLPKLGDFLSTKLFYQYSHIDGYYDNVTTGKKVPRDVYKYMGGTFLLEPFEGFSALLTYSYTLDHGHTAYAPLSSAASGDLICLLPAGAAGAPPANQCGRNNTDDLYTVFGNGADLYTYNEHFGRGEINWDLGPVRLTSVTGFIHSAETNAREDFDGTSANFFSIDRGPLHYQQFSEELRAAGKIGPKINYVFGGYYFRSFYNLSQHTYLDFIPLTLNPVADQVSRTTAVFGEVDWEFVPKWRVTVGGRYTWDKKSGTLVEYLGDKSSGITIFNSGPFQKSWAAFTPKVSVDYRPDDDLMFYGSYTKGYRAGGFSGRAATALSATTPYNPEFVKSYEVGTKTAWLDKRLQVNVAAFITEYDDKQEEIVVPGPIAGTNETIIVNAASVSIKGVEVETQAVLAKGLKGHAAISYLNGKYNHFNAFNPATLAPVDVFTRTLRRAPKVTFSVGLDYDIPSDFGNWLISTNYSHISSYQQTIAADPVLGFGVNDRRCLAGDQNALDASVTWSRDVGPGQARVSMWGRNLLDDRGLNACLPVAGTWTFANGRPPLTFGVTVGYQF